MYALNTARHFADSRLWNPLVRGATRVHLPLVTRNLQALDRTIRTIGELCARRLDRVSRLNVRWQGDRSFGLHSARVGKYIDVSCPFVAQIGRSDEGSALVHGGSDPLCYHKHT